MGGSAPRERRPAEIHRLERPMRYRGGSRQALSMKGEGFASGGQRAIALCNPFIVGVGGMGSTLGVGRDGGF